MIQTYIIKTNDGEYYCGKTNDIKRRLLQHENEKRPHWFGYKNRQKFTLIHRFKGDWESFIKRCGVKKTSDLILDEIIPAP